MEEEVEGMEEGAGDKRWTLRIPSSYFIPP